MDTFNVTAAIKIDDDKGGISFEPLQYSVPPVTTSIISVNAHDKGLFDIKLEIQASDTPEAMYLAESELLKLSNILSWRYNLSIKSYKVIALSRIKKDEDGINHRKISIDVMDFAMMTDKVSLSIGLGKESSDKLKKIFEEGIDREHETVLMMWREAVSEPSKQLQFILYYRVLEYVARYLLGTDVEKYIVENEPSVEMEKATRRGKGVVTQSIYSYLRDNMHPNGGESFPYQKLEQYLPSLANLARKAIAEKYPDLV